MKMVNDVRPIAHGIVKILGKIYIWPDIEEDWSSFGEFIEL